MAAEAWNLSPTATARVARARTSFTARSVRLTSSLFQVPSNVSRYASSYIGQQSDVASYNLVCVLLTGCGLKSRAQFHRPLLKTCKAFTATDFALCRKLKPMKLLKGIVAFRCVIKSCWVACLTRSHSPPPSPFLPPAFATVWLQSNQAQFKFNLTHRNNNKKLKRTKQNEV